MLKNKEWLKKHLYWSLKSYIGSIKFTYRTYSTKQFFLLLISAHVMSSVHFQSGLAISTFPQFTPNVFLNLSGCIISEQCKVLKINVSHLLLKIGKKNIYRFFSYVKSRQHYPECTINPNFGPLHSTEAARYLNFVLALCLTYHSNILYICHIFIFYLH